MIGENTFERELKERLDLIEAERRNAYKFELSFEYDVIEKISFGWGDIDLESGGNIYFQKSDLRVRIKPRFILRKVEDWVRQEARSKGEKSNPAKPIVHETDELDGYLTVHYQNGNYEWIEFNFRVRDGKAYLGSKTPIDRPRNGHGWIPPEVKKAILEHHPNLRISPAIPPWWS